MNTKKLFFSVLLLVTVFLHQNVKAFPALENKEMLIGGLVAAGGSYAFSNYLENKKDGSNQTSIISRACKTTDRGVSGATTLLGLTVAAAAFEGMEGPVVYTGAALMIPYFLNRLITQSGETIDMKPTLERAAGIGLLSLACNCNEIVKNVAFLPVDITLSFLNQKK